MTEGWVVKYGEEEWSVEVDKSRSGPWWHHIHPHEVHFTASPGADTPQPLQTVQILTPLDAGWKVLTRRGTLIGRQAELASVVPTPEQSTEYPEVRSVSMVPSALRPYVVDANGSPLVAISDDALRVSDVATERLNGFPIHAEAKAWPLDAETLSSRFSRKGFDADARIQLDWNCCVAGLEATAEDDSGRKAAYAASLVATWRPEGTLLRTDELPYPHSWVVTTLTPTLPPPPAAVMNLWCLVRLACFASVTKNWMALIGRLDPGGTVVRFRFVDERYELDLYEPHRGFLSSRVYDVALDAITSAYDYLKRQSMERVLRGTNALRVALVNLEPDLSDLVASAETNGFTSWWRSALSEKAIVCPVCGAARSTEEAKEAEEAEEAEKPVCTQCRVGSSGHLAFPAEGKTWNDRRPEAPTKRGVWCAIDAVVHETPCWDGTPNAHAGCKAANHGIWCCTRCWDAGVLVMNDDVQAQCSQCQAPYIGTLTRAV